MPVLFDTLGSRGLLRLFLPIGGTHESSAIWFERKFEFSFLMELLPNLCGGLRGTPPGLKRCSCVLTQP